MSYLKAKIYYIMLFTIILLSYINSAAVAANLVHEIPIHLKIEKYYILYTYPEEPFISSNRLLVSLKSIQDIMGGVVEYNNASKKANVKWLKHSFEFTFDSYYAIIDGKILKMDVKPTIRGNMLYVPIRILLDYTDVKWDWNQNKHFLHITDSRVVKGNPFNEFLSNEMGVGIRDENAIHLISYSLKDYKGVKKLSIKAINSSGHNILAGKADIQPLVTYLNNGGYAVDSYIRPNNPLLPMVKKDDLLFKSTNVEMKNASYIISVGRELE